MIRSVQHKLIQIARNELSNFGNAKTDHDRDKAWHRYQLLCSLIRKDIPDLFYKDNEAFTKVSDDAKKMIDKMEEAVILGKTEKEKMDENDG